MKKLFLTVSKYLGLFRLSEILYRRHLNILCYHGFSYQDEHIFRPNLFMSKDKFEARLAWLANNNFNVVTLGEGVERLKDKSLPPKTVVITIDDGFKATLDIAAPLFKKYDLPATVYVTSYHALKETPIFRLTVLYIAWKDDAEKVRSLLYSLLDLTDDGSPIMDAVRHAENHLSEVQRVEICRTLAAAVNVDYEQLVADGLMSLMNKQQIEDILTYGVDVQLHTHRHFLPKTENEIASELQDNRDYLEPLVGKTLEHFCYPCGYWEQEQLAPLAKCGIKTATTCEPGMNSPETHPLALKRFLDHEDIEFIEFEAEMRGYKELMRNVRDLLTGTRDRRILSTTS